MDIKNLLISKAKEIGVKVSPAQAEQFQIYLDLLLERNTVMNLTAITDPEEAVIKHFVDSLTLLKALEIKKNAKVIDVGTGAGFPGIPLKIMRPDIELTLLDSLNKRLVFLREVCVMPLALKPRRFINAQKKPEKTLSYVKALTLQRLVRSQT